MVASIDGSTVVSGASGELSSANDSAVMLRLRSLADVIIVGAGTVRAEGYGPPKRSGLRIGVVTASGRVDATTAAVRVGSRLRDHHRRRRHPDRDRRHPCRRPSTSISPLPSHALDQVCDAPRFVQAEGGPTLNGALFAADVDRRDQRDHVAADRRW